MEAAVLWQFRDSCSLLRLLCCGSLVIVVASGGWCCGSVVTAVSSGGCCVGCAAVTRWATVGQLAEPVRCGVRLNQAGELRRILRHSLLTPAPRPAQAVTQPPSTRRHHDPDTHALQQTLEDGGCWRRLEEAGGLVIFIHKLVKSTNKETDVAKCKVMLMINGYWFNGQFPHSWNAFDWHPYLYVHCCNMGFKLKYIIINTNTYTIDQCYWKRKYIWWSWGVSNSSTNNIFMVETPEIRKNRKVQSLLILYFILSRSISAL